jgi:hypothetical protein
MHQPKSIACSVETSSERAMGRQEAEMADIVSSFPQTRRPFVVLAGVFGLLLAVALALWAHYGTAVFFEMIRAGFAACF